MADDEKPVAAIVNLALALWSVSLVFQPRGNVVIRGDRLIVQDDGGAVLIEYRLESTSL